MESCPLCNSSGKKFYKDIFYLCEKCNGIFRSKEILPSAEMEKARYEQHRNDINDVGYQQFVSPISDAIFLSYKPHHKGLDFGAGPGPVVSQILKNKGYNIKQFDPFFHNHPQLLNEKYDYIVCCEVMEHFHNPGNEFRLLRRLLQNGGSLFCMTNIYSEDIDFDQWYYKNDFTHVFIYQKQTLLWIKDHIGFTDMKIDKRLIHFSVF